MTKRQIIPAEPVAISHDYKGLVAVTRNSKFLVDEINVIDGVVSIEGPTIKWDGTLSKHARYGTFPQLCTFEDWRAA